MGGRKKIAEGKVDGGNKRSRKVKKQNVEREFEKENSMKQQHIKKWRR